MSRGTYVRTSEHRARQSETHKGRLTPERLAQLQETAAHARASRTPEQVAACADALKRWNASEEGHAANLAKLEKIHGPDGWSNSLENLEHLSRVHNSWARSPEGKAAASSNYPGFSIYGKELRKRDGDSCQLCLEPIDFKLKKPPTDVCFGRPHHPRPGRRDRRARQSVAHSPSLQHEEGSSVCWKT